MFLASRSGRRWRWLTLALSVPLVGSFVWLRWQGGFQHGGSAWGLAYGVLALLLLLLLLAFGMRKRSYGSTLGTLDGWLQAHIYLGLLTVLVVLFHTGFRFEDMLAVSSFAVMMAVVVSGLAGVLLYSILPRLLTEVESDATAEEMSEQLNQLADAMARLSREKSESFQRIARGLLNEVTPRGLAGWRLLAGRFGRRRSRREGSWTAILGLVSQNEQEELRQLLVLSRQHRELLERLQIQQYYRNWLDAWLFLHLPLSIVLILLVGAHVVSAVFFRGLSL